MLLKLGLGLHKFGKAYDADAAKYFSAVEATGATLSTDAKAAIEAFVVGLKADGVWDIIVDMALFRGASTLAGALVKLKGSTAMVNNNFVEGDYSPTGGLSGNTSTKFLDTGIAATSVGSLNDHSIGVWVDDRGAGGHVIAAEGVGNGAMSLGRGNFTRSANSTAATNNTVEEGDLNALNRVAAAFFEVIIGAVVNVKNLVSVGPLTSENIYVFVRLVNGTPNGLKFDGTLSFYFAGGGLSSQNYTDLRSRLITLMGALS